VSLEDTAKDMQLLVRRSPGNSDCLLIDNGSFRVARFNLKTYDIEISGCDHPVNIKDKIEMMESSSSEITEEKMLSVILRTISDEIRKQMDFHIFNIKVIEKDLIRLTPKLINGIKKFNMEDLLT
jgi:hypothetical protein